ncbi:hypothetical protein [uncultured Sphingomonas sp.]|uniref:hypothetical protein n=1 Tax=uncultured Sphingomonas sp. TaxID=158754 RepID=UPI00261889D6|nr:hypothetical protein [uncultured Sphingomonas sp.]
MRWLACAALLLAGCGSRETADITGDDAPAGARLEKAAIAAGLVIDPESTSLQGSWARDDDRMCIVPGDVRGGADRIGILLDYGPGNGCSATGTVRRRRSGDLAVVLDACRFTARFDGERIVFPAELPEPCSALCTGRATLAAMSVERLSGSVAEARTLRGRNQPPLCGAG